MTAILDHIMRRCFFLWCVASLGFFTVGCNLPLPLAVFLGAEEGSGQRFSLADAEGTAIREDGYLLVRRRRVGPPGWKTRQIYELARVSDGQVRLPERLAMKVAYLLYLNRFFIVAYPKDEFVFDALVPGYYGSGTLGDMVDGKLKLLKKSSNNPQRAISWWTFFRKNRLHHFKPPERRISDNDWSAICEFVSLEIVRLEQISALQEGFSDSATGVGGLPRARSARQQPAICSR